MQKKDVKGENKSQQVPIKEGLFTWPAEDPRFIGSKSLLSGIMTT